MKKILFTIILASFFWLISNEIIFLDEIKINSINTFEDIKKENTYNIVFPGKIFRVEIFSNFGYIINVILSPDIVTIVDVFFREFMIIEVLHSSNQCVV